MDLDESHVAAFLKQMPERAKDRKALERAALRLFLRHLRDEYDTFAMKVKCRFQNGTIPRP